MPFPGVKPGSDTEKKIDRCVSKVMAANPTWSKSRAIATCRSSIEKKNEGIMPKKKKGLTSRQRRKAQRRELATHPEAKTLADNPHADIEAEEEFYSFDDFLEENDEFDNDPEEKYMDSMPSIDLDPPTDFEELDAEREAIEKAGKIRQVGWDADRLLSNVVHHPIMEPEEKEEKIKKIGKDFASRLTSVVQDNKEFSITEKQLEQTESEMWASFVDVGWLDNLFTKAKLTSAARKKLPDSAFACVKDGKRHLPIHDKAHVRNALARIPQMLKRGGDSAAVARCGRPKVVAAAKKLGIGKAGKENLNGILVEKDTEGVYRWIGWVSNNFRDRENEIISEAAHKEFVNYLDNNPDKAPEFWTWHTKGTAREGKVDAWLYHEGFLIMSGPLTDIEAYRLMKAISSDDIGMSHGFFGLRDPNDKTIITKYRAYEVCDLPLRKAANTWTSIETHLKKEVSSMNERLEYLKKLSPEGFVEGLLEQAEENKDFLEELGVESKEVDEPEAETTEEKEVEDSKDLTKRQEKVVENYFGMPADEIKEVVQHAAKVVPAMAKEILQLKEKLEKTEEEAEDTLADMIGGTQASKAKALKSRPSESDENIDDGDELDQPSLKGKKDDDWWGTYIDREEKEE